MASDLHPRQKTLIMGDINNLSGEKALEKIKELAKGKMVMFCTLENGKIASRPMSTQQIDDDGSIWFFSQDNSRKNNDIRNDPRVYLFYSNESSNEYLTLEGRASIEYDRARVEELWNVFLKTWFTEGKEDPDISLIRFTPEQGHYWDTKNNKMISLAKIAIGALTGKTMDDSIEGKLRV